MTADAVRQYILDSFNGVSSIEDEGSSFFFFDSENKIPFATIVASNKYDDLSGLDRPDAYRLNIGVGKKAFAELFPDLGHHNEEANVEALYDFEALDHLMPHPIYYRMYWVCVLNPSPETFKTLIPLIATAYQLAVDKFERARAAAEKRAL